MQNFSHSNSPFYWAKFVTEYWLLETSHYYWKQKYWSYIYFHNWSRSTHLLGFPGVYKENLMLMIQPKNWQVWGAIVKCWWVFTREAIESNPKVFGHLKQKKQNLLTLLVGNLHIRNIDVRLCHMNSFTLTTLVNFKQVLIYPSIKIMLGW